MTTEYAYDPDFPYVVKGGFGYPYARFYQLEVAVQAAAELGTQVIDTTPKPKIPTDAKFVTWTSDGVEEVAVYWEKSGWHYASEVWSDEGILDVIGEAEVTVLVPKETS